MAESAATCRASSGRPATALFSIASARKESMAPMRSMRPSGSSSSSGSNTSAGAISKGSSGIGSISRSSSSPAPARAASSIAWFQAPRTRLKRKSSVFQPSCPARREIDLGPTPQAIATRSCVGGWPSHSARIPSQRSSGKASGIPISSIAFQGTCRKRNAGRSSCRPANRRRHRRPRLSDTA